MQGGDSGRSESGAPTYVGSNVNVLWPLAHSEREWGRMGPWCTLVAAWHGCAKGERFGGVRGTGIASWGVLARADGSLWTRDRQSCAHRRRLGRRRESEIQNIKTERASRIDSSCVDLREC